MNNPVLRQTAIAKSQRVVPYLTPNEVKLLSEEAKRGGVGGKGCTPHTSTVSKWPAYFRGIEFDTCQYSEV